MVEYPPFPMMSSCIAVFRAPSSCPMSGFIFTLWLPSSKKRIGATDRTVVVYMSSGRGISPLSLDFAQPGSRLVRDGVFDPHLGERLAALATGDAGAAVGRAVP